MKRSQQPTNPFYVVLVIAGTIFAVTAFAYFVMASRALAGAPTTANEPSWGIALMRILDRHGMWIMVGELALLGFATFAAIATDDYWIKRTKRLLAEQAANPDPNAQEQP